MNHFGSYTEIVLNDLLIVVNSNKIFLWFAFEEYLLFHEQYWFVLVLCKLFVYEVLQLFKWPKDPRFSLRPGYLILKIPVHRTLVSSTISDLLFIFNIRSLAISLQFMHHIWKSKWFYFYALFIVMGLYVSKLLDYIGILVSFI